MSDTSFSPQNNIFTGDALDRVQVAPPGEWVVLHDYNCDFKRPAGALTYLLIDSQSHAEKQEVYSRLVTRLESVEAVQTKSQWRTEFEPSYQTLILHSLKVIRGERAIEQLDFQRLRVMQREAGLEGFVVDGAFTVLLLLEDVRIGDLLDCSFTVRTRPRLMPENWAEFRGLPPLAPVGRFYFSVRFQQDRPLRWKASPGLLPQESNDRDMREWRWQLEDQEKFEPEEGSPNSLVYLPWVHVSDCVSWERLVLAVIEAWKAGDATPEMEEWVQTVLAAHKSLMSRAAYVVQWIQDEIRYLSVNTEHGGQIPAPPGVVFRRRFGDCKDLSFLLVQLLQRLEIKAKPVLVNAMLGGAIAELLPATGVFNHVVVEYEIDGQRRWVDPTMKRQGGGALNRPIPNFGLGLCLDAATTTLTSPPQGSLYTHYQEVRETFLLDTAAGKSSLAVTVTGRGGAAEMMRHQYEAEGREAMARARVQNLGNHYRHVARLGEMKVRDDREANEFVIAEAFEIDGFIVPNPADPATVIFRLARDVVISPLPVPQTRQRKHPLVLPYPVQMAHIVELHLNGLELRNPGGECLANSFFRYSRTHKSPRGFLSTTFRLETRTPFVEARDVNAYFNCLEAAWRDSRWDILLPIGQRAMRRRRDFGDLPPPSRPRVTMIPTSKSPVPATATASASQPPPAPNKPPKKSDGKEEDRSRPVQSRRVGTSSRRRRPSRESKPLETIKWFLKVFFGVLAFLVIVVLVLTFAMYILQGGKK